MSDVTYIGKSMQDFESSPQFDGYSKVVITVSDEVEYSAGTDTGRTLTLSCPWGTQEIAEDILNSLRGFQYQPYTASDADLDPAAELGDGVTVRDTYGGIYARKTTFGSRFTASISAPSEEEIDHEYPYIAQSERRTTRQLRQMTAELKVQAGLISAEVAERKSDVESLSGLLSVQASEVSAKVSKTGGDSSSFGWVLDDSSWNIHANGSEVLKATKYGLEVNGRIVASSGKIGGFDIESNYLSYNNQTWGGTNTNGVYLGPSGIQLGKNFKVDNAGNLEAYSGTFSGYVKAGSIQYGGDNGTLSGSALSVGSVYGGYGGAIGGGSLSTFNMTGGINTSLGYADYSNGVFNGWNTVPAMQAGTVVANTELAVSRKFYFGGHEIKRVTKSFKDGDGKTVTLQYLEYDISG